MLIDHSTCSNAPACGGDEARETERSTLVVGERGCKPLDCEDVSPSASELDSASLNIPQWPTPRNGRSLSSLEKQWLRASKELGGVIEESARQRRNRDIRETSPVSPSLRLGRGQRSMGNHNHAIGRNEESEGFIVTVKRWKLRGVKGPYCKYVVIEDNLPLESQALHQGKSRVPAKGRWDLSINTLPNREAGEEWNPNRMLWGLRFSRLWFSDWVKLVGEPSTGNLYTRFDEGRGGQPNWAAPSSTLLIVSILSIRKKSKLISCLHDYPRLEGRQFPCHQPQPERNARKRKSYCLFALS